MPRATSRTAAGRAQRAAASASPYVDGLLSENFGHSPFPELVTPQKLLAFLESNRGRASKKDASKTITLPTYLQYVSAIVDLYQTQVRQNYFEWLHISPALLQAYLYHALRKIME